MAAPGVEVSSDVRVTSEDRVGGEVSVALGEALPGALSVGRRGLSVAAGEEVGVGRVGLPVPPALALLLSEAVGGAVPVPKPGGEDGVAPGDADTPELAVAAAPRLALARCGDGVGEGDMRGLRDTALGVGEPTAVTLGTAGEREGEGESEGPALGLG